MIIEELAGALGLDIDETGFNQAQNLFSNLKSGLLGIGTAAAAYLGGFAALTKTEAAGIHEAKIQADALGISVSRFIALQAALSEGPAGDEAVRSSLAAIAKQATAVAHGSAGAAEAFRFFGVEVAKDGALKSYDELLIELAKGFSTLPESLDKTAYATALFGESGAKYFKNFLAQGPEAIQKALEEMATTGLVLSDQQIDALEAAHQQFDMLGNRISGFFRQLAADAAPTIGAIVQSTQEWIKTNREWLKSLVVGPLQAFSKALPWIQTHWEAIRIGLLAVGAIYTQRILAESKLLGFLQKRITLTGILQGLEKALSRESLVAMAKWTGAIGGAIIKFGVLYLLIDELITAAQGGETAFGGMGEALQNLSKITQQDHPNLAWIEGFLGDLLNVNESIATAIDYWGDWKGRIDDVKEALQDLADLVTDGAFSKVLDFFEARKAPELPDLPVLPRIDPLSAADRALIAPQRNTTQTIKLDAPAVFNVAVAPGMSTRAAAQESMSVYKSMLETVLENAAKGIK